MKQRGLVCDLQWFTVNAAISGTPTTTALLDIIIIPYIRNLLPTARPILLLIVNYLETPNISFVT